VRLEGAWAIQEGQLFPIPRVTMRAPHVEMLAAEGMALVVPPPERSALGVEHRSPRLEHQGDIGGVALRGLERRSSQLQERVQVSALDLFAGLRGARHAV
jgi:hypothetical protein